jgi:hypothetical protein
MFVTVRIPVTPPEPLLKIPAEAIRPGETVWVNNQDRLQVVHVVVADTRDDFVLVKQSRTTLTTADRVVVSPLAAVQQDMLIREQGTAPVNVDAQTSLKSESST